MPVPPFASWMLEQEARALLTRLARVKPFALQEPMLPAAALFPESQAAIEGFLSSGRRHLKSLVDGYLGWLRSPRSREASAEEAQRRFTMLRLQFNRALTHFDLFDNVITQRSESETGIWLSGLDVASADALTLRGRYYQTPPVICYLDRGVGAAIRRARTRLPGGGSNPVAIVKIPRERMVGSGIASSLFHEVGHQAAALLGLVESLRPILRTLSESNRPQADAWSLWERWISEIVADLWSVGRAGIASTLGLMGVVSLPRPFVFRLNPGDPHPAPWIRVKLSGALGAAIYPQPAWARLVELWESYYPIDGLDPTRRETFERLEQTIPTLVSLLVNHRPRSAAGRFDVGSPRHGRVGTGPFADAARSMANGPMGDVPGAAHCGVGDHRTRSCRRGDYARRGEHRRGETAVALGRREHFGGRCPLRFGAAGARAAASLVHCSKGLTTTIRRRVPCQRDQHFACA